jgi:hypothetical protein
MKGDDIGYSGSTFLSLLFSFQTPVVESSYHEHHPPKKRYGSRNLPLYVSFGTGDWIEWLDEDRNRRQEQMMEGKADRLVYHSASFGWKWRVLRPHYGNDNRVRQNKDEQGKDKGAELRRCEHQTRTKAIQLT